MVLIHEYDESMRVISPKNVTKRHTLLQQCMKAYRRSTERIDWEFLDMEVYGVVFVGAFMNSDIDSVFSSSYSVDIVMELSTCSFSDEVLIYDLSCLNDPWVTNFQDQSKLSNINDEVDTFLEPCVLWGKNLYAVTA